MSRQGIRRYTHIPTIRVDNAVIPVYLDPNQDVNHGEYITLPKQRILIAPQEPRTLYASLLHEALHAIADSHGINSAERTIRCYELGVVSLIARNPKLVRGLQKHNG